MVLIIKAKSNIDSDLMLITKMMANIEYNKQIYNNTGCLNTEHKEIQSFNYYTHDNVNFDINVNMGVILFYIDPMLIYT